MVYIVDMQRLLPAAFFLLLGVGNLSCAQDFEQLRSGMVVDINTMVGETRDYIGKHSLDQRVMQQMANVPRHEFVPADLQQYAYLNRPLPIGNDQTISQPYIVALMTDLAGADSEDVVLEIGTGSGYQAAVLAGLVKHVYTIEIIEVLGTNARQTLERLGYHNISVRIGDGYLGWPEFAPFDIIMVTAAPDEVPQPLLDQLKPGGRLIIPVGPAYSTQSLRVIEKDASGNISQRDVLPVGFVPLTRQR